MAARMICLAIAIMLTSCTAAMAQSPQALRPVFQETQSAPANPIADQASPRISGGVIGELPSAQQPIYLPSPFTGPPRVHVPGDLVMPRTAEDLKRPLDVDAGVKQIVLTSWMLRVDDEMAEQIMNCVDARNFTMTGAEIKSAMNSALENGQAGVIASESILKGTPALYGQISEEQFKRITDLTKATTSAYVIQHPTVTAYDGQSATIVDGATRPFVVGVKPTDDGNGTFTQTPMIQIIEEGTIVKHNLQTTPAGVQLDSSVIFNSIVGVETYTMTSSSEPVTIQIPECRTKRYDFSFEIGTGNLMLVDSGTYEDISSTHVGGNRLFRKTEVTTERYKLMFVFQTHVIE